MKLFTLAITLSAVLPLSAQITLGEATLPTAGDRFETVVDTSYTDANGNIGRVGANQTWIFGDVEAESTACTAFRAASEGAVGADFPDADLVVTTGRTCDADNAEAYLVRDGGDLSVVGLGGGESALPVVRLATPVLYQRAPFRFGDAGSIVTEQRLQFGGDILTLFVDDPNVIAVVDSVRVDLAVEASVAADAWGRAGLSASTLTDVLRVARTTTTSQSFEVKIPLLGWVALAGLPGLDQSLLPPSTQTVVSYEWWGAERAGPLFRVTVDSLGGATTAERDATLSSLAEATSADGVRLRIAAGGAHFSWDGVRPEDSAIRVYASNGAHLASATLRRGTFAQTVSVAGWPAGVYFARVTDAGGHGETLRFVLTE